MSSPYYINTLSRHSDRLHVHRGLLHSLTSYFSPFFRPIRSILLCNVLFQSPTCVSSALKIWSVLDNILLFLTIVWCYCFPSVKLNNFTMMSSTLDLGNTEKAILLIGESLYIKWCKFLDMLWQNMLNMTSQNDHGEMFFK